MTYPMRFRLSTVRSRLLETRQLFISRVLVLPRCLVTAVLLDANLLNTCMWVMLRSVGNRVPTGLTTVLSMDGTMMRGRLACLSRALQTLATCLIPEGWWETGVECIGLCTDWCGG